MSALQVSVGGALQVQRVVPLKLLTRTEDCTDVVQASLLATEGRGAPNRQREGLQQQLNSSDFSRVVKVVKEGSLISPGRDNRQG